MTSNAANGPSYSSYSSYNNPKYNSYYPSYGSYNTFKRDSTNQDSSVGIPGETTGIANSYSSRPNTGNRGSLSNSIPKRDRSRNNSVLNVKRADTYYPSNSYFNKSQVDHYSTKKKYPPNQSYSNQSYYDSSSYYGYKKGYEYSNTYPEDDYRRENSKYEDHYKDPSVNPREEERDPEDRQIRDQSHDVNEEDEEDEEDGDEDKDDNNEDSLIGTNGDNSRVNETFEGDSPKPMDDDSDNYEGNENYSMEVDAPQKNLEPGKDLKIKEQTPLPETTLDEDEEDGVTTAKNGQQEVCKFPSNKLDAMLDDLKTEFEEKKEPQKYSAVIDEIKELPSYRRNLKLYQYQKPQLLNYLKTHNSQVKIYTQNLWKEYKSWNEKWEHEGTFMEQQLRVLHPPNDEMKKEIEGADIRIKYQDNTGSVAPSTPSNGSSNLEDPTVTGGFGNRRSSRRHGDLVTTEAEFEEVLKNLTKQDDEDPMLKALRVSAYVPDLLLDPNEGILLNFMDSNNLVKDKAEWATRVRTEFFDNFSPEEHVLFCDGFVKYPKKFGYISKYMGGLRTTGECVIHYYLTKKGVNYKNLVMQYKKKTSKKNVIKKKPKSRNTSVNQTPIEATPEPHDTFEEVGKDEFVPADKDLKPDVLDPALPIPQPVGHNTDAFGEELFTETGRRKRAAAPTFEEQATKKQHTEPQLNSPTQSQVIEVKKKPRKKKDDNETPLTPKDTPKEEETDDSQVNGDGKDKNRKTISSYWSITEASEFPVLLKEHGTKWTTIADKLSTKTATMVRNYFQRNAEKYRLLEVAQEADKKLEEKFAAVLSKPETDETVNVTVKQELAFPIQPHQLIAPRTQIPPQPQMLPSASQVYQTPPQIQMQPFNKPSIGALITHEAHPDVHKPSIMSLLNSDSPVTNESSQKTPTTDIPIAPELIDAQPKRNNINTLLNSPSSSSQLDESNRGEYSKMPKLSTILADSSNDNN
ncbi:DNA-binding protein snt1 [Yamadazyma tenuis]|uniref:DNA-binding protein snt1 n=1 Tax=Candida tenuis TaxID=2315449 RepID=UPI00279A4C53|nr:DNA-binding protein snt1 [Yamadazyma tenuis]